MRHSLKFIHVELFLKYIMFDSFKIVCNKKEHFFLTSTQIFKSVYVPGGIEGNRQSFRIAFLEFQKFLLCRKNNDFIELKAHHIHWIHVFFFFISQYGFYAMKELAWYACPW